MHPIITANTKTATPKRTYRLNNQAISYFSLDLLLTYEYLFYVTYPTFKIAYHIAIYYATYYIVTYSYVLLIFVTLRNNILIE